MAELPEGVELPSAQIARPRPSAAAVLSRGAGEKREILLCHRVSEVPSFPDFWAFPGGGVSRVDRAAAEANPDWFAERDDGISLIALLREMVEEVGIAPDGSGGFLQVTSDLRDEVNSDKASWAVLATDNRLLVSGFSADLITERTTPPLAPVRFANRFYHVDLGDSTIEPTLPSGRSEFDEFRWWKPAALLDAWLSHSVKLPPPQVTLIRDLVEHGFEALAQDPPSGYHIIEFAPGVECVPLPTATLPPATHTNCYVLGQAGGPRILVDPAAKSAEALEILSTKVTEIQATGSEIIGTIFTHRHPDHIGDLSAISSMYQAPILASSETHEVIPPCDTDSTLKEGDEITLGEVTWTVIETPGHCPGHICLCSEAGIISGDNATVFGTILVPSGEGDMNAYLAGLERLRDIDLPLLFPGHGPMVANPTRLLNRYLKHRKARHSRVLEAVISGKNSLADIASEAYSDTPDAHPHLARDQTLSHLKALEKSGEIYRIKKDWYKN